MFQGLVIRCSVYSNIIGLTAKHCFCTKLDKSSSQSKVRIDKKINMTEAQLCFYLFYVVRKRKDFIKCG